MEFAADPPSQKLDEGSRRRAVAWEQFVVDIFLIYQKVALREVEALAPNRAGQNADAGDLGVIIRATEV